MCGICGILDLARSTAHGALESTVEAMASSLAHRGPDDHGAWIDAEVGVALGHRRLSIIDLTAAGHQPMVSAAGRFVIVYNGEIYNHAALALELRGLGHGFRGHSDTEVLLAGFEQWGVRGTLERANGMFALGVWDRAQRQLSLGRDRLGEKPLYWGRAGKTIVFGSELKALRAHPAVKPEIDRDALTLFFRHKYIPAPHTIYRGTEKLLPGEIVTIGAGGAVTRERYWEAFGFIPGATVPAADPTTAINTLEMLLLDAVRLRMVADVPLGAFLSGGVDSSTIVALMQALSPRPVKTFTIGSLDPRFDESVYADAIARHLGTDHTTLRISTDDVLSVIPKLPDIYDEPFADSSQIPTHVLSTLTRKHVTVSLSGDGGDELFRGYNRHRWVPSFWRRLRRYPAFVRRVGAAGVLAVPPQWFDTVARLVPGRLRPRLLGTKMSKLAQVAGLDGPEAMYLRLTSHWTEPARLVLGSSEPATLVSSPGRWPAAPSLADQLTAIDLVTYLPDDILTKLDRASMAAGLEGRVPFLDHRVVEHALGLGADLTMRAGQSKWILRQVLSRYVPTALVDRAKTGFGVPVGLWLRGPLREWADELLAPDRLRREGFLCEPCVTRLWRQHRCGRRDHTYRLWDVVMFQAWLERWGPAVGSCSGVEGGLVTRKPRILFFIKGLGLGGAERMLVDALPALLGRGYDCHVAYMVPWKSFLVPQITALGVPVTCLDARRSLGLPGAVRRLKALIGEGRFDLVHAHLPLAGIVARVACRHGGPPVIYTEHNVQEQYRLPTRWGNSYTYGLNRHVIAVSASVANSLRQVGLDRKAPMTVIPNGIPVKSVCVAVRESVRVRRELGIPPDALVVGTVAVMRVQKRLGDWLQVARRVCDRHGSVVFLLAGEGPEAAFLKSEVNRLGLDGRVLMPGFRPDGRAVIGALDVFLMSSEFEGLPIALLEALALGKAVVATAVGGVPEAVTEGKEGFLSPVGDVESMASRVLQLLGDSDLRIKMGKAAAETARTRFDLETNFRRIEEIYASLVNDVAGA